jgi:hypothetical protein
MMLLAAIVSACSDETTRPAVRVTSAEVTDELVARLRPDGSIALPESRINPVGEVGEAQARSVAARYVRDVAAQRVGEWSQTHGGVVRADDLTPCGRAVYAATPYTALEGSDLSEMTVRAFGPHWVVPMCSSDRRLQVVVAFSSLATELVPTVAAGKRVPWERSDVMSFGVPATVPGTLFSVEGAVSRAASLSGKRIKSVPDLLMNPMPGSPVLLRWQIELESPIKVVGRRSASVRERAKLMVGFGETFGESGMLDYDLERESAFPTWKDAVTGAAFTVKLKPNSPDAVELVTRGDE